MIFSHGGFIRTFENLGARALPYKISEHGLLNRSGHAFVIKLDVAPKHIQDIQEEYHRDVDIIRRSFFKLEEPKKAECTLHEELQPPAYRKEVIEMMEVAKKNQKEKYPQNTGLNYYPFQK